MESALLYIGESVWRLISPDLKLSVDAPSNVSIIRPTSGADGNEKALGFNELQGFDGEVSEEVASIRLIDSGEKKEFDTRL